MDRLTEIEAFAMVVDQGGFTDAAKRLGVSKSAVSKHISSLEMRLGAQLLNRTTRRVSPTEIGLAYYQRARRLILDAGEADALVTAMQSAPAGQVRIAVAPDMGQDFLTPILADFALEYPEITVTSAVNTRPMDGAFTGFDLAIHIGPLHDSGPQARQLGLTSNRMIASPAYFQKHGRPLHLDEVARHVLLPSAQQPRGATWKIITALGKRRVIRAANWLALPDGQSPLKAALAGLGMAYLPHLLCAKALHDGTLQEAMPDLPDDTLGVYAVYPPSRFIQPKMRVLIDFLERRFACRDMARDRGSRAV